MIVLSRYLKEQAHTVLREGDCAARREAVPIPGTPMHLCATAVYKEKYHSAKSMLIYGEIIAEDGTSYVIGSIV